MLQVLDVVHPANPERISCLDIKRSGSGSVVFDLLISIAGGPASINYLH